MDTIKSIDDTAYLEQLEITLKSGKTLEQVVLYALKDAIEQL